MTNLHFIGQIIGADGPPGPPSIIKGDLDALSPVPTAPEDGELHLIVSAPAWAPPGTMPGDALAWSENHQQWVNVGRMQGPSGPTGPQGDPTWIQVLVGDGTLGTLGHIYIRTGTGPLPTPVPTGTVTGQDLVAVHGFRDGGDVQGPQGERGGLVLSGSGNPSGPGATPPTVPANGFQNGDLYLNTTSGDLFQFEDPPRQWTLAGSLAGPQGVTGDVVHVRVGDGVNGTDGHVYTATVADGDPVPAFTGATPAGWTEQAGIDLTGPQGPQAEFGSPTSSQVAAGGAPTVAVSGSGTTLDPYILAFGLVDGLPVHVYLGQNDDADSVLYAATATAAPATTADVAGATAGTVDAALVAAGWTKLGDIKGDTGNTGPQGNHGHTPEVTTGTDDPTVNTPTANEDGDWYLQTHVGTDEHATIWTKVSGAWTDLNVNVRGPMGPALTIKGDWDTAAPPPLFRKAQAPVMLTS